MSKKGQHGLIKTNKMSSVSFTFRGYQQSSRYAAGMISLQWPIFTLYVRRKVHLLGLSPLLTPCVTRGVTGMSSEHILNRSVALHHSTFPSLKHPRPRHFSHPRVPHAPVLLMFWSHTRFNQTWRSSRPTASITSDQ